MVLLTRPKILLFALAVVAVAAAAVLALRSWPSDTLDAASVLSKSRDAQAKILDEATEGKVFHFATREFRRHGPGEALIREMSEEWYVPEWSRHEFWAQVGPAGAIARWHGALTDAEGNLIQEATEEGEAVLIRDVASGSEERLPLDVTVEEIARNVGGGIRDLEEDMGSGAVTIVGYGNVADKKTIVLEWPPVPEPPVPEPAPGTYSRGYSLPYTLDLAPVERIERLEIDAETFLPVHDWCVAVDAEGTEHLIEEWAVVVNEIIDPAAVPAWVFEER